MFVGHLALAFAAKPRAERLSLGWLIAAVTFADLLWPIFLLLGIERARIVPGATAFTPLIFDFYPWSHSLLMLLVWGMVLMFIVRTRFRMAGYLLVALVVSHWMLDWITHAPDMPIRPGESPRF